MVANGPSLMPGCIPDDCARGHPLLFHFLCSLWIRCFGASNFAVHSFALLVSLALLTSVYECSRKLFGHRTGLAALLLLATNVLFFVQSAFILPEVAVALFTLLSLYYYVNDRFLLTLVMLTLLFFIKESGLIFGLVLGVDAMLMSFRARQSVGRRVMRITALLIPALLIGTFFLVQKARLGWYLSPEHSSLVHLEWSTFYPLFKHGLDCIFRADVNNYLFIFCFILLSTIPAIKLRDVRYLFLFIPATAIYVLTCTEITGGIADIIKAVFVILSLIIALFCLFKLSDTYSLPAQRFVIIMGCCFVAYLGYLSLSLVEYRYLLVDMVFVFIFMALCLNTFINASGNQFYLIAIAAVLIMGAYGFYADEGNSDSDLESFHAMHVQQKEISFLEQANAYDDEIIIGCYWAIWHFKDPKESYLSTNKPFSQITHGIIGPTTCYAIFDNICDTSNYQKVKDNPAFKLVFSAAESRSWAEIYNQN